MRLLGTSPKGHYSPAVVHGGVIYVSGQLPLDAEGKVPTDFEAQVRQCLANLESTLRLAGASPSDLLKVTVFVAEIDLWPEFNRLYAEWIGAHRPARVVVPVKTLNYGAFLEIDAIAREAM